MSHPSERPCSRDSGKVASESPALGLKLEPHFDVKLAMNSGRHNSCRGNLGRQPTGYEVADERVAFQLPASLPSPLRQVLLNCMRSAAVVSATLEAGIIFGPALMARFGCIFRFYFAATEAQLSILYTVFRRNGTPGHDARCS